MSESLDEPQCHRYKSSIDDAVDFEMMLQDASSTGDNAKSERSVSQPPSDSCRTLPRECVAVKPEPGSNSGSERSVDSQPLNFSISVNSAAADDARIRPSSADVATSSATSPDDCDDSEGGRLRRELAAAVAANLALQEELSARDFHLAQLAEDFFCLHEQFKQLARHFQAVLGDIQPLSDQANANCIVQNHTG